MARGRLILGLLFIVYPVVSQEITFKGDLINIGRHPLGQIMTLEGRAVIESDEFTINADKIELIGANFDEIRATGRVLLVNKKDNSQIRARRVIYDQRNKKLTAFDDVNYSDGELEIRTNYLEEQSKGVYLMRGLVRLLKDNFFAKADSALFNNTTNQLQLLGDAWVYRVDDRFSAMRIDINTKTEKITMNGLVSGSVIGAADGD